MKRKEEQEFRAKLQQAREVRKMEPKPGRLTKQELQKAKTEVERWDAECPLRGEPQEEPLWFTEAEVEAQLEADILRIQRSKPDGPDDNLPPGWGGGSSSHQ